MTTTVQGSIQEKIMVLREKTGAGIMDCKKALVENGGEVEKAVEFLRKKGLADVAKRSARTTKEGIITVKVSADGKTAVLSELTCETDFVAKTPDFKKLGEDIAAYVLATDKPDYAGDAKISEMVLAVAPKLGENIVFRRAARYATTGALWYYLHGDNKKAALVELACDNTSADAAKLRDAAKELAMQIVAMSPRYVAKTDVPAAEVEKEKEIYTTQAKNQGKPDAAIVKMLDGRIKKFYEEVCLLSQTSVRDSKKTVEQYLAEYTAGLGKVTVRRFVRYQLGA
ncbi:MAG: translation elongation factor Ts [Elusimicrobiales bacterium]